MLLSAKGAGMLTIMQHDRGQLPVRDLFSTEIVGDTSSSPPTKPVQKLRHALPADLPNSVKHLTDAELDRLLAAAMDEAKRRGRLPPSFQPNLGNNAKRLSTDKRQTATATVSVTRGQMNAVFAAFKAGVKASQIARQFDIAQSDVHKVVRSLTTTKEAR